MANGNFSGVSGGVTATHAGGIRMEGGGDPKLLGENFVKRREERHVGRVFLS